MSGFRLPGGVHDTWAAAGLTEHILGQGQVWGLKDMTDCYDCYDCYDCRLTADDERNYGHWDGPQQRCLHNPATAQLWSFWTR